MTKVHKPPTYLAVPGSSLTDNTDTLVREIEGLIGRDLTEWHRAQLLELVAGAHFEVQRASVRHEQYQTDKKTIGLVLRSIQQLQSLLETPSPLVRSAADCEIHDLNRSLSNMHQVLLSVRGMVSAPQGRTSNNILDEFIANAATLIESVGIQPTASWNSKTSNPGPSGVFAKMMLALRLYLPTQLRCASEEAFVKSVQKMLSAWRRWPAEPSEDPTAWGKKRPPADRS